MSPFEVFDRPRYGRAGFRDTTDPYVKVMENGQGLYLSVTAQALLGPASHVAFLFDKENHLAALKPTGSDDPNANKVSRGRQVAARLFVKYYGIQPGLLCPARWENELLMFEVGEPSG
jgi:hypothetical protein